MFHKFSGLACPFFSHVSRWTVCVGLSLLGRVKPRPHFLFSHYPSFPAEVRLATSGRTAKCVQQLSSQTLVPAKEEPQILAWNSLFPVFRQTERSHCETMLLTEGRTGS